MVEREKVEQIIFIAIDEINQSQPEDLKLKKSKDTVLFGEGTVLDSLGLVNLIVAVEQKISDEFDVSLTIANDQALSQVNSPFKTVRTLSDYILTLLDEAQSGK